MTLLIGAACGGTLEDDYRRGRLDGSEPSERPSTDDEGEAGSAHSGTKAAGNMGFVGESTARGATTSRQATTPRAG